MTDYITLGLHGQLAPAWWRLGGRRASLLEALESGIRPGT